MNSRSSFSPSLWHIATAAVIAVACNASLTPSLHGQADTSREGALERFTADLKYLASDELAGRLPGTPEMEECLKYIVADFEKHGLKAAMPDGTYLQTFDVGRRNSLIADQTSLVLSGPNGSKMELKLNDDYTVQLQNDAFDISGDVVFVGFGIDAEEHNFNEYANVDVKDKVVVFLRMEPQQDNPDSVFDGTENSRYASIRTKVAKATEAGAKAIIMVNDSKNAESDELAPADMFGRSTGSMPFINMKRAKFDEMLKSSPMKLADGSTISTLADAEARIDKDLEPVSQAIAGWTASAKAGFEREQIMTSNIIGVIEGDGEHADETIVIGGHYDHLGMGAFGSRSGGRREVHNGADDNATGTAGIMELVRRFQARDGKPKRRLVFIAFTAEEMGLLGAQHYVNNPVFPLENTVAMVNYDMIGWLRDDKLTVYSWETAPQFKGALDRANEGMNLNLVLPAGGFAGSDHLPFMQKNIPVMFLHTGLTETYHTPEDDFETINCEGAVKVVDYTERLIDELANLEERPTFEAGGGRRGAMRRVRLGASTETVEGDSGAKIVEIAEDSISAKAGLKVDDVIKKIGDTEIKNRRDVIRAAAENSGKKVKFTVVRDGQEVVVEVDLGDEAP